MNFERIKKLFSRLFGKRPSNPDVVVEDVWMSPSGLECMVVYSKEMGHRCGYARLPWLHPLYKTDYSTCLSPKCRLTREVVEAILSSPKLKKGIKAAVAAKFSAMGEGLSIYKDDKTGVYKVNCYGHSLESLINVHGGVTFADNFQSPRGWWVGFDCAHYDDAPDPTCTMALKFPSLSLFTGYAGHPRHHWTLPEVKLEAEKLAEQLIRIKIHDSTESAQ